MKAAKKIPTLKPVAMFKSCSALHPEIQHTGRMCPACHEVEASRELLAENAALRTENSALKADIERAALNHQADLNGANALTIVRVMEGFNLMLAKLGYGIGELRAAVQGAEVRTIAVGNDAMIKLGALDDAISVLLSDTGLGRLSRVQISPEGYVLAIAAPRRSAQAVNAMIDAVTA